MISASIVAITTAVTHPDAQIVFFVAVFPSLIITPIDNITFIAAYVIPLKKLYAPFAFSLSEYTKITTARRSITGTATEFSPFMNLNPFAAMKPAATTHATLVYLISNIFTKRVSTPENIAIKVIYAQMNIHTS